MPEKKIIERAKRAAKQGKAPTTQAGEFVRDEMHHMHEGKHSAHSKKQAIAIGLSKARQAGIDLPNAPTKSSAPAKPKATSKTKTSSKTSATSKTSTSSKTSATSKASATSKTKAKKPSTTKKS